MIEDATIYVNSQPFSTRLHEHGKEPTTTAYQPRKEWMYSGYMEGKKSTLDALVAAGGTELKFYKSRPGSPCGDKLEVTLLGVVWGPVCNMYDEHYILHLNWATEDPKPYDPDAE